MAQSIKIPVELELRQLQGSINTLQNALNKLDPGSKIYKSIEGSLFKLTQRFNSLEAESKKSFGSVKEINSFEQKFNKVNDSVQELAYLLNKVSFEDLGQIFSDSDLKPIEEARNKIKQLQSDLTNIKTDKMNELANSSKDFKSVIDGIKGSTFKDKLGGLDREISSVDKTIESSKENIQKYTDSIQETRDKIDKIRKISTQGFDFSQFLTADKKKFKGNQNFRGKEQLSVALSALGYDPKTINEVIKVATSNISEAQKLLQAKTTELINKNNNILKVGTTAKPALEILLEREEEALKKFEAKKVSLESARTQLKGIELDPSTQQSIDILNQQIEEQTQIIQQLKIKLLELSGIYDDTGNVIQDSGNAFELSKDKIDEARASMIRLAEAQEKLDSVKHAIKNWFGFNEVINMSKNAVRNAITHIRELDKTMTEIAIVTDMTQQELWGQIDVYSALAQQYGATTKGVYEVSQLYYQQGLQTAEVMDLTSETLKMARISSLSYSDATDYMTVALRGFKLEMSDAQNIVDVYSNIAAVSASDTEELAVAMSKTASSAEAVGSSFENTTAMIALMVETTREAPENIGSAMKSIISRYGEMTSDPMKLVDSEGEEMSLNKVDKALQSVGISLQDAQGQFRNFDDVILELAESWDTIDKNTQRYIATVMAGNRQQSRFLALVGNYERLKELTEEAANSEDAAQLQILKTMDSIETKLNQLKVTYQEFYTNTGVEELIKNFLDFTTNVIKGLNDIPKVFNKIPIAAISTISVIIKVVKASLTSIVAQINATISQESNKLKQQAAKDGTAHGRTYAEKFKAAMQGISGKDTNIGMWSGIASAAGAAISTIGLSLSGLSQKASQVTTGIGNMIAGVGSMLAGGPIGWVTGAISIISGLITTVEGFDTSAEEKIEQLKQDAEEAKNEALLLKNEFKTLDTGIKKLEQLKEERYDSAEAAEEYKTAVDNLANQYPELIKSYDAVNGAVLDASAQERLLAELRQRSADATLEAALAEAKLKEEEYKQAQTDLVYSGSFEAEGGSKENYKFSYSDLDFLYQEALGVENFSEKVSELTDYISEYSFLSDATVSSLENGRVQVELGEGRSFDLTGIFEKYQDARSLGLIDESNFFKDFSSFEKFSESIKQFFSSEKDYRTFINELYGDLIGEYQSNKIEAEGAKKALNQSAKSVISAALSTGFNETSVVQDNSGLFSIASTILEESFNESGVEKITEWIESQNYKDEAETVMEEVSNYWNSLTSSKQQIFQQMFENPEQYSGEAIIQKLNITDTEIQDYIRSYYEDIYTNNKERVKNLFNETFKNYSSSDIQKEFLSRIEVEDSMTEDQADFYSSAIEQTNKYIEEGFKNQANDYLEQITLLIDIINSLNLNEDVKNELYTLMNQQDLSTWEGIQSFIKAIQETEAFKDIDISNLEKVLTNLGNSLIENLTIGISSVEDKIVEKIKTINESLEDMTGELSAQDAFSAYKKMKSADETIPAFSEVYKQSEEDPTKYILSDVEYLNKYREEQIKALEEESQHLREKLSEAEKLQTIAAIDFRKDETLDIETFKEKINEIDETSGKIYEELGIWDKIYQLYLEGSYTTETVTSLISEKIAEGRANIAALEALGADSSLASQITSNLDIGEFTEATKIAGDNSQWINYINRTKEEAYDTLLQDFLSGGVKLIEEESYKYVGEVKSAANNIISSTDPIAAAKELALVAGYTIEEINEVILQATEESTKQTIGAAQDALKNLSFIDKNTAYGSLEDIEALASALEIDLDILGAVYNTNLDAYVFDTDKLGDKLNSIANQDKIILEAQLNFLNEILGHLENAFDGSLEFGNIATLSEMLGQFGIQVDESDFTRMEEGFEISRQKAFDIVYALKEIDSISAKTMIGNLAEQLEEAGSGYEDVASTMKTIAELNRELADVPVSSERRAELERELAVAEEILRVRSQDPDSFNFMDKDLPTGMQGPENYWNSVGEAYKVMNESAKSGYMEIQDYVNIVNQMESMAIAAGQEFSIGGMNAAQLIEKGMSSLKNIDGEGVKIAMKGVGIDFANAATDMGLSFDDGIKEVAKSQIKMLDAAIRMLEAMVAMENIDADSDGFLSLEEIFVDPLNNLSDGIQESDWQQSVIDWADDLEDAAGKISIGGKSLLDALATLSPKQVQNVLNQLMSIDWTLGDTDIASQIQNILSAYFPDIDITQGKSVFDILEIPDDADTKAEHFGQWLDKVGLELNEYEDLKRFIDINSSSIRPGGTLFDGIVNMLGIDKEKNKDLYNSFSQFTTDMYSKGFGIQDVIKAWDEITIEKDGDSSKYTYNNTAYDSLDNALKAMELSDKTGEKIDGVHQVEGIGSIQTEGTINVGNSTFKIQETRTGAILYVDSKNVAHNTLREAIEAEVFYKTSEDGVGTVEAYAQYGVDITAEGLANVSISSIKEALSKDLKIDRNDLGEPTITIDDELITFEAGTTEEQVRQKLMEAIGIDASQVETIVTAISTAISTADWSPVGKAINEALTGKVKVEEGVAEGIEIGELTFKPEGLKVDTSEAGEPTLSSGEEALSNVPITSLTLTPETLYIDIANKTPQLKDNQTVTIENIPSATGTVTGSITITNNGTWSAAESQTSPEVTGYTSANGTVETVTINGSSFKVTPVAGAPTNLDGELNPVESGFVKVEGNYYSIDLSSGTQLNPGMDLSGVTAGSAQVNATSYTVTFINADGTTSQSVIVQGEAQLNAVLQNATLGDNGGWILSGISAEADVSISTKSENALVNFFDTLVNKLKNIEVTYQEPTSAGPGPDTSTLGYYVEGFNNFAGSVGAVGRNKGHFDSMEQVVGSCNMGVNEGTFTDGTFNITEIKADGTQLTATDVALADLQAGTVIFSEGAPTTTGSKEDLNRGQGTGNDEGTIILPPVDTIEAENSIQAAASTMSSDIADAGSSGGASAASAIQKTLDGIKSKTVSVKVNYPPTVNIGVNYSISVTTTSTGPGTVKGRINSVSAPGLNSYGMNSASGSLAKGNVNGKALASGSRKTLMGELGPELVVSNGRYFIVGQNGAEFVDLADDAIVFNHLQTKKLLNSGSSGYGKPVTNEKNAVSFATGNVDGPAMASASAALAQLRQIRAMWQTLLDASIADLGAKAGMGKGGGGGGGGGGDTDNSAVPYDLEKWYNWLRKIAQLEQEITLEQAKRENMASGTDRARSLSKEIDLTKEQLAVEKELADAQYDYYQKRAEEVNNSIYGEVFNFDPKNGLMQFKDLSLITQIKEQETAEKQLSEIIRIFKLDDEDIKELLYDENGQKIKTKGMSDEEIAKTKVENFFNNMDLTREELEELYDSVYDHQIKSEELQTRLLEIQQERIDHQLELEQTIYDTLVDIKERQIKNAEDYRDTIQEASKEYLEGLNKALDNELKMYNANQEFSETSKLQNRLAILQRSGGSASEIKALQEQIDSRLKDAYFQEQQDQIDAIQAASDAEIERLDTQISLMEDTLAYEQENGLIWDEVSEWMGKSIEEIIDLYTKNNEDYLNKSELGKQEDEKEFTTQVEQQKETERLQGVENSASEYVSGQISKAPAEAEINDIDKAKAEQAYKEAYEKTEGSEAEKRAAAEAAAKAVIDEMLKTEPETSPEPEETKPEGIIGIPSTKTITWNPEKKYNERKQKTVDLSEDIYVLGFDKTGGWAKVSAVLKDTGERKEGYVAINKYSNFKNLKALKKELGLGSFSEGGLVDYTGLAMVHGSKTRPESFISAEHTKLLKESIFSKHNNSIKELDELFSKYKESMKNINNENDSSINIENVNISVHTDAISNGYDARRAGQEIFDEMVRISRKTGNVKLSRR